MSSVAYHLLVETDQYSGNFEREMTAAATGVVGECGVGDEQFEDFFDAAAAMGYDVDPDDMDVESPFADLMEHKADDNGCHRPCSIAHDSNNEYKAVEMYMYQRPAAKDLAFMAQRIRAFAEAEKIQVKSIKLIKVTTTKEVLVLDDLT